MPPSKWSNDPLKNKVGKKKKMKKEKVKKERKKGKLRQF